MKILNARPGTPFGDKPLGVSRVAIAQVDPEFLDECWRRPSPAERETVSRECDTLALALSRIGEEGNLAPATRELALSGAAVAKSLGFRVAGHVHSTSTTQVLEIDFRRATGKCLAILMRDPDGPYLEAQRLAALIEMLLNDCVAEAEKAGLAS